MDDFVPLEISAYFGLNSKTSKDKLYPGFSSSSDTFHDIDLSQPGVAKTRGGSDTVTNLGYLPRRIFDWYVPYMDYHYIVTQGGTKVTVLDQTYATLAEDTGFTDTYTFDFLAYGDELFYGNGVDGNRIASIISSTPAFRNWGITKPSSAPTFAADSGTGISGTFTYVYTYVNTTSGHESSASDASSGHSVTNKTINLTGLVASADPQVDKINIYRTTDSGAYYYYLAQINNGTTTYADSIADTALGTTQAPAYNDPPPVNFKAVEEWDGVIWGFEADSTVIYFSNTEFYSVVGNPEESFHPDNYIDLRAKIFGIRRSPNFNELWVHTSKGIYAIVPTFVPADAYRAVIRCTTAYSGTPYAIVNIYNEQWFVTEDWRALSIDSAGNIEYESKLIEPDLNLANKTKIGICHGCHYRGGNKNQFRFTYPTSGQTYPNRMLAANYLQRTPPDDEGKSHSVWEYHKIASTTMGVVKDLDGNDVLYTGDSDGNLIKQDYGTNDDGAAISWSHELGWFRGVANETKSMVPRWLVQYFNPLGSWSFTLSALFDFGLSGGDSYTISLNPVGDKWDIDFTWDVSVWGYDTSLQRTTTDLRGVFSHAQFVWSGSGLDQVFECHSVVFLMHQVEGFRSINQ